MVYELINPPDILKDYVRNFWLLEFDLGPSEKNLRLHADSFPRLTFQYLDRRSHIRNKDGTQLPQFFLRGIMTSPVEAFIHGRYAHVAVSFFPHALERIFGIKAFDVIDRTCDLSDICPPELLSKLTEATSGHQRISLLSDFFTFQLQKKFKDDAFIKQCILASPASFDWNINSLIHSHQISERQLERKFRSAIGISPKTYLRISRFEKAVRLLQDRRFDRLSGVATDLGYADHSHFTRDFKSSAGLTPQAYLGARRVIEYGGSFLQG